MRNKIYILQDERMKEQTGEVIIHKFVVSTFKKFFVGDEIPMKLKIDNWEDGKKEVQFVNVKITKEKGNKYYEGVVV